MASVDIPSKEMGKFFNNITKKLDNIKTERLVNNLEEFIALIKADAQERVPVNTGTTKNSYFQEITTKGNLIVVNIGYDKAGEYEYIPIINEKPDGFFRNGKEPFWLRRAFEANRDKAQQVLSK